MTRTFSLFSAFQFLRHLGLGMSAALMLIAGSAGPAVAGTLNLAWDPSQQPQAAGYLVYYGLTSGNYTAQVDAGTAASVTVTGLQDSTKYYLAVATYDSAHNISPLSAEVSGTSTRVTSAAAAGSTGGSTATGATSTGTAVTNPTGTTPGAGGGGGGCAMSSEHGQGDFLLTAYVAMALAAILRRRSGARRTSPRFEASGSSAAHAGATGMAAVC
ncbi:MAG: fibronectin type III domain-containing protein [Pseudomonadota bacterium]|nr:fibronectin type III domain-containing protein [Pseudomonadota bacterium]